MLDGEPGRRDSSAVQARLAHHLADDPNGLLLDQRQLIALGHDLPPFIDLLVNVDLHRTDTGAAAIERRGVRKAAVFADIEHRKSGMPSRCVRPLSTKTICSSAPGRGARKCEVYCVMGEPSALRDSMRMNTPRCSIFGMIFSMPMQAMCNLGTLAERSALPSLVQTTKLPFSATAKFAPVIPASARRK